MKSQKESIVKIGGIVFNLGDPDQKKMYEHVKSRTNFSAYMKRLIQRDMDSVTAPPLFRQDTAVSPAPKNEPEIDDSTASSFI